MNIRTIIRFGFCDTLNDQLNISVIAVGISLTCLVCALRLHLDGIATLYIWGALRVSTNPGAMLIGSPIPNRSQDGGQTRSDPLVLQVGG